MRIQFIILEVYVYRQSLSQKLNSLSLFMDLIDMPSGFVPLLTCKLFSQVLESSAETTKP